VQHDLSRPFDLSREARHLDDSGTPTALIEFARREGDLVVLPEVSPDAVLVEYPMGRLWARETGCSRFVRLRYRHGGKRYALVRPAPATAEPRLIPYAENDLVGERLDLAGAGIMAYMTGDHMHPPMVDDESVWADAEQWRQGAVRHTREAAELVGLHGGERVLDIGCGVGGPARTLVDEFGVTVYGIGNSMPMIRTARAINATHERWARSIAVEFHDCQEPCPRGDFDVAWSLNMAYAVPDKRALLRNAAAALRPRGRLMLDDWMFTGSATDADRLEMDRHYTNGSALIRASDLTNLLASTGFQVVDLVDLARVGRTHLARHAVEEFNRSVRPRLEADFPGRPLSGKQMADEWAAALELQARLYREGKMTYRRVAAVRSNDHDTGGTRL
jgi:cyclopropane fatty-acyl-phospholipid synthase-like methyltransferase